MRRPNLYYWIMVLLITLSIFTYKSFSYAETTSPPTITGLTGLPPEGETTDALVDSVTVQVSEALDASTVNASSSWDMREAGADGVFDTADDTPYSITTLPTYTTGTSIGLFINGGPLPTDTTGSKPKAP